eukprot:269544-Chlamydomonas_euryale.AAC.1
MDGRAGGASCVGLPCSVGCIGGAEGGGEGGAFVPTPQAGALCPSAGCNRLAKGGHMWLVKTRQQSPLTGIVEHK